MSAPDRIGIWVDPVTKKHYDALTLQPITTAGADLGEKPRPPHAGPPVTEDDLEEFARQLAGRAKRAKPHTKDGL